MMHVIVNKQIIPNLFKFYFMWSSVVCYHLCCIIFSWLDHFIAHFFLFFFLSLFDCIIIYDYILLLLCFLVCFFINRIDSKILMSQVWVCEELCHLALPKGFCSFVCSGMAQSLGMGSGQTSGLHHTSMKYSDQPQGPDTFTDFVTLVCQEAQSSQNQVHTLCLTHTLCLVSHTPCVLSHTYPVSCLTNTMCLVLHTVSCLLSTLCFVLYTPCIVSDTHSLPCQTHPVFCFMYNLRLVVHTPCVLCHTHTSVSCLTHTSVSCLTNLVCCLLSTLCVWTHTFCVLFRTHCVCVIHTSCLVSHPPCVLSHTYTHSLSLSLFAVWPFLVSVQCIIWES